MKLMTLAVVIGLFLLVSTLVMTMLVMLLLGLGYIDLYKADDDGGGNSAIPIDANIGDDHVGCSAVFMLIMGLQELVYI